MPPRLMYLNSSPFPNIGRDARRRSVHFRDSDLSTSVALKGQYRSSQHAHTSVSHNVRGFKGLVGREGVSRSYLVLMKIGPRPRLSCRARSGSTPSPVFGTERRDGEQGCSSRVAASQNLIHVKGPVLSRAIAVLQKRLLGNSRPECQALDVEPGSGIRQRLGNLRRHQSLPAHKPVTSALGAMRDELPEDASLCAATAHAWPPSMNSARTNQKRGADDHGGSRRVIGSVRPARTERSGSSRHPSFRPESLLQDLWVHQIPRQSTSRSLLRFRGARAYRPSTTRW